jgi:hypothetical protein
MNTNALGLLLLAGIWLETVTRGLGRLLPEASDPARNACLFSPKRIPKPVAIDQESALLWPRAPRKRTCRPN